MFTYLFGFHSQTYNSHHIPTDLKKKEKISKILDKKSSILWGKREKTKKQSTMGKSEKWKKQKTANFGLHFNCAESAETKTNVSKLSDPLIEPCF